MLSDREKWRYFLIGFCESATWMLVPSVILFAWLVWRLVID